MWLAVQSCGECWLMVIRSYHTSLPWSEYQEDYDSVLVNSNGFSHQLLFAVVVQEGLGLLLATTAQ